MPSATVGHCLQSFNDRVQKALKLQSEASKFRIATQTGSYRHIGNHRVELLAGLALLRIHLAWEDFVESAFVRYMCGAVSPAGYTPTLLANPERSIAQAMASLLGRRRDYLNWSPHNITSRAGRYFDRGEPFQSAISAIRQTVNDIVVVRNRFAHRSEYASKEFHLVVRNTFGYVPRGINAGRFLLRVNPSPIAHGQIFLDFYANTLIGAARSIAR